MRSRPPHEDVPEQDGRSTLSHSASQQGRGHLDPACLTGSMWAKRGQEEPRRTWGGRGVEARRGCTGVMTRSVAGEPGAPRAMAESGRGSREGMSWEQSQTQKVRGDEQRGHQLARRVLEARLWEPVSAAGSRGTGGAERSRLTGDLGANQVFNKCVVLEQC